MTPFCDVCHAEAAVVGPFCLRCSNALLDAEARRLLTLKKEGERDLEERKDYYSSWEEFWSWSLSEGEL